jgi:transcriptional regulator with XRE-family HTH domain
MSDTEKNYNRLLKKLAKNIKDTRTKKKIRQADMIEFGFSERFIQKVESGKYSPNLYTVHRIAEALEISFYELFK